MGLEGDHFLKAGQIECLRPRVTFTMCHLWQIQTLDGTFLRFASHDKPVKFEGSMFTPVGATPQNAQQGEAGEASDFEIIGFLSHDSIRPRDIKLGKFDGATITQWVVDWERPWIWTKKHKWWIKTITMEGSTFRADLAGVDAFLEIKSGRYYEKECDKTFQGTECAAQNVPTFTGKVVSEVPSSSSSGDVLGVTRDTRAFQVDMSGESLDHPTTNVPLVWSAGSAEFASGSNTSRTAQISQAEYDGSQYLNVVLSAPLPFPVRLGDTVNLKPGCDGAFTTCRVVYDNLNNFGGIHRMPSTQDQYEDPELSANIEEIET